MTGVRLSKGGRVNRERPVSFTWDGRTYTGFEGDTLASALMAHGEMVFGRSFKYHRPRGIMSAGVEESGAIVSVGAGAKTETNVKMTTQEIHSDLIAHGQNAWPNVRRDMGALSNLFSRFFAAGFYYKTFMGLPPFEWGRGTWLWMQYEKIIRKAAGMGRASRLADPDTYDHGHIFCDVLVVGSGPAGLNAALEAAKSGKDVVLVEQDFELGGDYLSDELSVSSKVLKDLVKKIYDAGVRVMTRTTCFGLYDHGTAGLIERVTNHMAAPSAHLPRQRFWTLRAQATILATGALERSIAFAGNDLPGVMTAAAVQTYIHRFGVLPGQNVVVATNNDSAYGPVRALRDAGAKVTVLDARENASCPVPDGVLVMAGTAPLKTKGRKAITGIEFARKDESGWSKAGSLDCDLLAVSGGWSPVVNLLSHRGAAPVWDADLACFLAPEWPENIVMAGSSDGLWVRQDCVKSGRSAVKKALGAKTRPLNRGGWDTPIAPLYEVKISGENEAKAFVDPQHDVTSDDVRLAHQEGFVSVEHLKRYTTLGMATDQGKMGNIIGLALMADALGKDIPEVGTTRFRPPYTPVPIGAFAGRNTGHHFRALRRTPMHDWNLRHGATMTEAGLWQRPWYFAQEGETIDDAYLREARTVRENIGICDVSSLGKIAVQGPDASEFLNRVYTNAFEKLPVGKSRYGIMLRDDGMVMDDGTTWRLSENDFLMTTTTSHAAKVMVWLEELLQTRWSDLKVHVASVSDQWAGVSVAGPNARVGLEKSMIDPTIVSAESLPFMAVTKAVLKGGIDCLIARISFSGELAFEVYVPAGYAEAMMDLLWASTNDLGGCLYGLEALGTLRIEKGHVTGAELDGRVTIDDAGLGKMASTKKSYIGSALRQRPEMMQPDRPKLVGILPKEHTQVFNGGALLFAPEDQTGFGEGWVTAGTQSPVLGHWIGLGFISGGHEAWAGKTVLACDPLRKKPVEVEIVSPHMYDPKGERMHG